MILKSGARWAKGLGGIITSPGLIRFFSSFQRKKHSMEGVGRRCCFLHLTLSVMSWLLALGEKNKTKINKSVLSFFIGHFNISERKNQSQRKTSLPSNSVLPLRKNTCPCNSDCHRQMSMCISMEPFALLERRN